MNKELEFLEEKHGDNSWGHYPPSKREVAQWLQEWTEKQCVIPVVSSSFSIGFAQYIAENHYKLVNVENGKYYWKNETHLKTSQQLMKTFKDTIDFK